MGVGGFKVIYLIFLIGDRGASAWKDVRLVGRSDSERTDTLRITLNTLGTAIFASAVCGMA